MRRAAVGQRPGSAIMTRRRLSRWTFWRAYLRTYPGQVIWSTVCAVFLAAIPVVYWVAFASQRPAEIEFRTGTLLSRDRPRTSMTPMRDVWRVRLEGEGDVVVAHGRSFSPDFAVGEALCLRHTVTGYGAASVNRYYVFSAGSCPP